MDKQDLVLLSEEDLKESKLDTVYVRIRIEDFDLVTLNPMFLGTQALTRDFKMKLKEEELFRFIIFLVLFKKASAQEALFLD